MNRRTLLFASLIPIGTASALFFSSRKSESIAKTSSKFEVTKTEAQWRKILTPEQFEILRKEGTERAGTSPLTAEHRKGKFACAGCNLPLFVSETKFESGTGWPSFYAPIANAVKTSVDTSFGATRTEVHCRRCGGHLGHVFQDGPKPTGLRYCMNGVAMKFIST
ncbi:peptide-methionine (R)-S-oxide reductase MsrB [Chamaesiphon sp.]|uniref:peptide-methionine (R)-S-oxide reductase MsrB n=1 Tax=Chamaesiphon sp. TaxID=2814140 RepID=UPI0035934500